MDFIYVLSLLFAGYSVVYTWDSNGGQFEKRQLVPLPRIGRSYMEVKRQGLIPSPRVGRSSSYNGIENDCPLNPETCYHLMKYRERHDVHDMHESLPILSIGPSVALKKRSSQVVEDITNDIRFDDLEFIKTLLSMTGNFAINEDFFERSSRQLAPIPRIERSENNYVSQIHLISGLNSAEEEDMVDPIDLQLRAAFIPRLGKRADSHSFNRFSDLEDLYKRAAAFTPRIGRAAFTPRIGKKAAFVPRIGRSTDKMADH